MADHEDEARIVVDPNYWWHEASDMWRDAELLAKAGGSRKAVSNFCHGTLERAIKALMAERNILGDTDKRHNLVGLFISAGVFDSLPSRLKDFIRMVAGLHMKATYPNPAKEQLWDDDTNYSIILRNTKEVYLLLLRQRVKDGEEGTDGSN